MVKVIWGQILIYDKMYLLKLCKVKIMCVWLVYEYSLDFYLLFSLKCWSQRQEWKMYQAWKHYNQTRCVHQFALFCWKKVNILHLFCAVLVFLSRIREHNSVLEVLNQSIIMLHLYLDSPYCLMILIVKHHRNKGF